MCLKKIGLSLILCCWVNVLLGQIVITEIMADPTPAIGLPGEEYLELLNNSTQSISLKGWKLQMGSRLVSLPDSVMKPGEYRIVCHRNNVSSFTKFGPILGLSVFSLTNDEMILALFDAKNRMVQSLQYQIKWWDSEHQDGGTSLEIIDSNFICSDRSNWKVSRSEKGGTPGAVNSIYSKVEDHDAPILERIEIHDAKNIRLVFNEKMDSLNVTKGAYLSLNGLVLRDRILESPLFCELQLLLETPLGAGEKYILQIRDIADCSGNLLREANYAISLPSVPDSGEIVINEILFNPADKGVEFIELYNTSNKSISLKDWSIVIPKSDGTAKAYLVANRDIILPSFGFIALTSDKNILKEQFPKANVSNLLEIGQFPILPNTSGEIEIRDPKGGVYDRLIYDEKMHHPLISDRKGVALERIDPTKSTLLWSNWASASSVAGFGTPGYANSQQRNESSMELFKVEPEAFSPDGDQGDDYTVIRYNALQANQIATVRIYNLQGGMVRNLLQNQLLGVQGELKWDGTDDQGRIVKTGYYFILIEAFDTSGKIATYKCKVVVATRNH